MSWTPQERRAWLFPPMSGVVDDIDLAYLDPADADERRLMIEFDHPELREALVSGTREIVLHGEVMSPGMHISMHEVVANQIWDGEPEVTRQTAERLSGLGYERHEVLHMLASVVVTEVFETLQGRPHRPDRMAKGMAALPESWEAERPDGQDRPTRRHRKRR